MDNIPIRRSKNAVLVQIAKSGLLVVALGGFCSWLLGNLLSWAPNAESLLNSIVWVVLLSLWIWYSITSWLGRTKENYYLGPEALYVQSKTGIFGRSEAAYNYEQVASVHVTESFWGKRFNYGDVSVLLKEGNHQLLLRQVDHPSEVVSTIRQKQNQIAI
jgi:uncharacterized membrane protein YdbT with pleckstrin-like domain